MVLKMIFQEILFIFFPFSFSLDIFFFLEGKPSQQNDKEYLLPLTLGHLSGLSKYFSTY
jgi:hypothetical protein